MFTEPAKYIKMKMAGPLILKWMVRIIGWTLLYWH